MPELVIIGGPNGAGKTTIALKILPNYFRNKNFVNADAIAKGLSGFNPSSVDFNSGRIMLNRLTELQNSKQDFSFETTLASKSFVPFLKECKNKGYKISLIYVWVNAVSLCLDRVKKRKNEGGHYVPDDIVRRRYERSRLNFIEIYLPLADEWIIYDNSKSLLKIFAEKRLNEEIKIYNQQLWKNFMKVVKETNEEYEGDKLHQLAKAAIREELIRKYRLNLPMVFVEDGKIIDIEGKDLIKYVDWPELREKY